MKASKYFVTVHDDQSGRLDTYVNKLIELYDDGAITSLLVGAKERSDASKDRENEGDDFIQYHVHCKVKFDRSIGETRLKDLGLWVGGLDWAVQKGTDNEVMDYITKDGPLLHDLQQGSTNDRLLIECIGRIKSGEIGRIADLITLDGSKYLNLLRSSYKPLVELALHEYSTMTVMLPEGFVPYCWQYDLVTILKEKPNNRQILFVVDPQGNSGKTKCMHYIESMLGRGSVEIMRPGKNDNVSHKIRERESTRVFVMDCPRSTSDFLQYRVFEELKDLIMASDKYNSSMKYFRKPAHVVVFMNEEPRIEDLSEDRVCIAHINTSIHSVPHTSKVYEDGTAVRELTSPTYEGFCDKYCNHVTDIKRGGRIFDDMWLTITPKGNSSIHRRNLEFISETSPCYRFFTTGLDHGPGNYTIPMNGEFEVAIPMADSINQLLSCKGFRFESPCVFAIATIDLRKWPSSDEISESNVDMLTGMTDLFGMDPAYMSPDGLTLYRQVLEDITYVGDDKMCFGEAHAKVQSDRGDPRRNEVPRIIKKCKCEVTDAMYKHVISLLPLNRWLVNVRTYDRNGRLIRTMSPGAIAQW